MSVEIATRVLKLPGSKRVTVRVERPRSLGKDEWACTFRISGGGFRVRRDAHGVDSLQALLLALRGIGLALAQMRQEATWIGGRVGDPAIAEIVPPELGAKFTRRVSDMIETEAARQLKRREKAHRARQREK